MTLQMKIQDERAEAKEEGRKEGREEGREEGRISLLVDMLRQNLSEKQLRKFATEEEIKAAKDYLEGKAPAITTHED